MSVATRRIGSASAVFAIPALVLLVDCTSFEADPGADAGSEGGLEAASPAEAVAPPVDAGDAGCSTDLQNDSAHCGSCDYSCGAGKCFGGACVAERLGTNRSIGPYARIAVRGPLGGFTDDQPRGAGNGSPGYFYSFVPDAANPVPEPGPLSLDHATFAAAGRVKVHFVSRGSGGSSIDGSGPLNETITGFASSPSGDRFAARTATRVLAYDEMFTMQSTLSIDPTIGGRAFDFYGESSVVLATSTGVVACNLDTAACAPLIATGPVSELAVLGSKLVYATAEGVQESVLTSLSSVTTATPSKPLLTGLSEVGRIVLTGGDAYVLASTGIHTTRYGKRLLVPTLASPVLDFAVSDTWLYLLRADGLSRVPR